MKKIIILILWLIVYQLHGQDNLIQITYQYNDGLRIETGDLFYKNDSTVFVLNDFTEKNTTDEEVSFDESHNIITINQKAINIAKRVFYHNLGDAIFYQSIPKNDLLIKDEVPEIQWEILSDEIREIGNYTAVKAIGEFRGSKIECYFTYDIPISIGPWKFSGLPGLILEIYTSDNKIKWEVIKIQISEIKQDVVINFNLPKGNIITQKEFVSRNEEEASQIFKQIQSRALEGAHAGKVHMKRLGIEKIYEWEVE